MILNSKATALPSLRATKTGAVAGLVALVQVWSLRARARRDLARLDSHMLRDIGLDPMTAAHESSRPFWQD